MFGPGNINDLSSHTKRWFAKWQIIEISELSFLAYHNDYKAEKKNQKFWFC